MIRVAVGRQAQTDAGASGEGAIYSGALIRTMDPAAPTVEAIAVKSGNIDFAGDLGQARLRLPGATVVDLGGGILLPGFIDSHHHYCVAALDRRSPDLHVAPGSSVRDVLALVERYVSEAPGRSWIRAGGYDPSKLRERRAPRREELDEISPDRPILLHAYSFHDGVANTAGLVSLGWDGPDAQSPPSGRIVRDRRGRATGELIETAYFVADATSRNAMAKDAGDALIAECEAHGYALLRAGITRVGDAAVPPVAEELYQRALAQGRMPIAVHRMPVSSRSFIEHRLSDDPTGSGDKISPRGAAKLFLDGADNCALCMSKRQMVEAALLAVKSVAGGGGLAALRAAARTKGWKLQPDGLYHRGYKFWDQDALESTVRAAGERGLQVAQHALGNDAVMQAVTALERAGQRLGDLPGRPRLEHTMMLDAQLAGRIADVGAIAVMQPNFIYDMGDELALMPLPRPLKAMPMRTLLEAGVELAGSSDYPVSDYNVLQAIEAAVTRRARDGAIFDPSEAISAEQAIRAYTVGSAIALGVEDMVGTLSAGKQADMVHLAQDPMSVAPEQISSIDVRQTWVAGNLAFARLTTV